MGYKTMQGKIVDLEKLMSQNELMPAIGNMKVNARGDELGPGGKIIKKREEVVAAYYEDNPNARGRKATAPVVEEKTVETTTTKQTKKSEE
jgi:hypothetical protein